MTILLTGGAGFIGSHVAVELLEAGYQIVLADNFCNSAPAVPGRIERITGKAAPCCEIDVTDRAALAGVFAAYPIDAVIHFAGLKCVPESVAQPLSYYRNNLDATLSVLEVMAEYQVKRFIFSSSATVYGEPETMPVRENMPTGNCTNPYGWTKLMIERFLLDAAVADPSLSVVLLRYFNPVGAHQSGLIGEAPCGIPNNLMPYILQTAAGQRPYLNVYGNDYPTTDGTGVRDYIHVVDLARGHVAALRYAEHTTGAEAINLGSGQGTSVLEMVRAFEAANQLSLPYQIGPRRAGDIAAIWASPAKAKALLNWETEKSVADMCKDSWHFQQTLAALCENPDK